MAARITVNVRQGSRGNIVVRTLTIASRRRANTVAVRMGITIIIVTVIPAGQEKIVTWILIIVKKGK